MTLLSALSFLVIGLTSAVMFLGSQYTVIKLTLNWFNFACAFAGGLVLSLGIGMTEEYRYNSLLAQAQASPSEVEELRATNRALNEENNRLTLALRPKAEIVWDTSWFSGVLAEYAEENPRYVFNCEPLNLLGWPEPVAFVFQDSDRDVCYPQDRLLMANAFGEICHFCDNAVRCR